METVRPSYTLREIAARFGGEVRGDPELRIDQVATLESATATQISFLANPRYRAQLESTRAGAVVLPLEAGDWTGVARILCANPYALFARVSALLNPPQSPPPGIHPAAIVHQTAQVAPSASVGPLAVIGAQARIGAGSMVAGGACIGERVQVGADCRIYPNVTVYHDCVIGERVILHAGAVIGADGFGLAMDEGRWHKIPQIGRVCIGDDVEVGANTTIDRGALDDTIIEEGVKLDNQIQIGHNCRIGAHTAIAGCAGIAGSTRIGRYCRIGGSAMIAGHLQIADNVEIAGGTGVPKSISKPGTYISVFPMSPYHEWLKNAAHIRHLDALAARVRALEGRLAELEGKPS
jgi:UDP-3-O-[3-hydroxymyristoyl] glucosamine N-acyltransferase